jgi:hypothetical protein
MKEFLSKLGEVLSWMFMLICFIVVLICNQYAGYRQAERDILKSCVANNELIIDDIKFACVKCPKRNNNDKK